MIRLFRKKKNTVKELQKLKERLMSLSFWDFMNVFFLDGSDAFWLYNGVYNTHFQLEIELDLEEVPVPNGLKRDGGEGTPEDQIKKYIVWLTSDRFSKHPSLVKERIKDEVISYFVDNSVQYNLENDKEFQAKSIINSLNDSIEELRRQQKIKSKIESLKKDLEFRRTS